MGEIGDKFKEGQIYVPEMLIAAKAMQAGLKVLAPSLKAEEIGADIVCLSALLTTTMPAIETTIKAFEDKGIKDKYIFMIGGAPVSEEYAKQVHADYYTTDAAAAADVAKKVLQEKK